MHNRKKMIRDSPRIYFVLYKYYVHVMVQVAIWYNCQLYQYRSQLGLYRHRSQLAFVLVQLAILPVHITIGICTGMINKRTKRKFEQLKFNNVKVKSNILFKVQIGDGIALLENKSKYRSNARKIFIPYHSLGKGDTV